MVGRSVSSGLPEGRRCRSATSCWRRATSAAAPRGVRGVSLSVRAGEILGLAGLVGAGRTELARVLFGLTPADGGQILLQGQAGRRSTRPPTAVELGIAYVPEDRRRHGVILEMPVAANTTLAVLRRGRARRADRLRRASGAIAATFVERLGTKTPSVDTPVGNLSGGNQQKVALARWLAAEPSVIILDEPTQGVDVGAKAEIHRLMGELAARGLAIIMISSELPEVLGHERPHRGHARRARRRACSTAPRRRRRRSWSWRSGTRAGAEAGWRHDARSRDRGGAPPRNRAARGARRHERELSVAAAYVALLLLLAVLRAGVLPAAVPRHAGSRAAPVLVVAVGMTLVILARHIDISVGSQFSVCGVARGAGCARRGCRCRSSASSPSRPARRSARSTAGSSRACGLPSIVVTLATMVILRESLRWAREGEAVRGLPADFQWFGAVAGGRASGCSSVAALAVFAAVGVGDAVAGGGAERCTPSARTPRPRGSRACGRGGSCSRSFVLTGALTGLAAMLERGALAAGATSTPGVGLELQVIAAVVVGGAAITGGRGTLVGTLLGVALLVDDRPDARLPRRPAGLGAGDPGADHPPRRRVGRAVRQAEAAAER